jgi:hypothetical protein
LNLKSWQRFMEKRPVILFNMFLDKQDKKSLEYYGEMLKAVGAISRLFSDSNEPYIPYRVAENLFCKAFSAENLSRSDCSVDASRNKVGIGVKTFLEKNGNTMQKVAEFNSELSLFNKLPLKEKILKISELRNERIEATKRIHGLDSVIYHCVTRRKGEILAYETPMDLVQIKKIKNVKENKNIISFKDGLNSYSFNVSKSTLYKRFETKNVVLRVEVKMLKSPFDLLEAMLKGFGVAEAIAPAREEACIFLPLYSEDKKGKFVAAKSGLNQWNAKGRPRNPNEVYIPIPAWIHRKFPGFFPPRDVSFELVLPNGNKMSASLCQDGSKALMSNPNSALGEWLLRDVLNLKERKLLTYKKLQEIGFDSVVIYKKSNSEFDIDFRKSGSYDDFSDDNEDSEE